MKVVVAGMLSQEFVKDLRDSFPGVDFQPAATEQEQKRHIKDADVFFGTPSRDVFLSAERLRWIHCPGTGIDRYAEVPELLDSDVVLTNARGPHTNPMADHAFGMILTFAHHLRELWDDQRARRWDTRKYDGRVVELSGRTMGILALGGIGMAVARRAHGFGMSVYAVDKRPMPTPPRYVGTVWGPERLDDLLRMSDWFVITAPLTSETKGLIDRRRIGLLKPSAYLIVVSRGGIIDEDALIEALRSGRLAGAGLDVTAEEPLPQDSPLWDMENVLISPHSSALTPDMWEGRRQIFKENLKRFLANEPFLYVCDKQAGF
jgi:phosphoglycerate dehydrogenase-like enzyme